MQLFYFKRSLTRRLVFELNCLLLAMLGFWTMSQINSGNLNVVNTIRAIKPPIIKTKIIYCHRRGIFILLSAGEEIGIFPAQYPVPPTYQWLCFVYFCPDDFPCRRGDSISSLQGLRLSICVFDLNLFLSISPRACEYTPVEIRSRLLSILAFEY